MMYSLPPHELQNISLPYPSLSPGVCSNSRPLSQWCHPTISSSVVFSSCPQYFLASGSFLKNRLFASGGQRTGGSAGAFLVAQMAENLPAMQETRSQSGRSPGGGHSNTFQYFWLENSMHRGAWPTTVQGRKKLDTTKWLTLSYLINSIQFSLCFNGKGAKNG